MLPCAALSSMVWICKCRSAGDSEGVKKPQRALADEDYIGLEAGKDEPWKQGITYNLLGFLYSHVAYV